MDTFNRAIRYYPKLGCTYINNPKAACTTIKFGLAKKSNLFSQEELERFERDPKRIHELRGALVKSNPHEIYADYDNFKASFKFTFVRNPYIRYLSAYLNKIDNLDTYIWPIFAKDAKIDPKQHISYKEFLQILERSDIKKINEHFQPQYLILLVDYIAYDFIGHLETLDSDMKQVSQYVSYTQENINKTDAKTKLDQYYNDETIEIVQRIGKKDFELFGYSMEYGDFNPDKDKMSLALFTITNKKQKEVERFLGKSLRKKQQKTNFKKITKRILSVVTGSK